MVTVTVCGSLSPATLLAFSVNVSVPEAPAFAV